MYIVRSMRSRSSASASSLDAALQLWQNIGEVAPARLGKAREQQPAAGSPGAKNHKGIRVGHQCLQARERWCFGQCV
eukprot:SAG11_NODE_184_length_13162_cov_9.151803_11_plen_77_part_00